MVLENCIEAFWILAIIVSGVLILNWASNNKHTLDVALWNDFYFDLKNTISKSFGETKFYNAIELQRFIVVSKHMKYSDVMYS